MSLGHFVRKRRQLYAISADGFGLLTGTLAPSRKAAIVEFQLSCPEGSFALNWEAAKRAGYRTVRAVVEITDRTAACVKHETMTRPFAGNDLAWRVRHEGFGLWR